MGIEKLSVLKSSDESTSTTYLNRMKTILNDGDKRKIIERIVRSDCSGYAQDATC